MKIKTLFLLIFISANTFGQNPTEFKPGNSEVITEGGNYYQGTYFTLNKYIVLESKGTAKELYEGTLNWINETFNTPDEVIKGKIENEYIRFQGSTDWPLFYVKIIGGPSSPYNGYRYMIETKFKDDRFRFEIVEVEVLARPTQYTSGGWTEVGLRHRTSNKKGKLDQAGKMTLDAQKKYFNDLAQSLKKYLDEGGASKSTDDDW